MLFPLPAFKRRLTGFILASVAVLSCLSFGRSATLAEESSPILQIEGESPFGPDAALLEVFFINVGHGDAFLLRLNGQTLLIDGGLGEYYPRLRDFLLQENGSLTVDAILNTHQHDDHIAGIIALLKRTAKTSCFFGPLAPDTKDVRYQALFPLLAQMNASYVQLRPGDTLLFGGGAPGEPPLLMTDDFAVLPENTARIEVYRCEETLGDVNSSCLVLHITYGDRTLLLMADAMGYPQTYFLKTAGEAMKADIIKVAHHGLSVTVQAFLDMVDPMLGIVTNGRKGTEAQARQFLLRGIPALYTGEGTISLSTDGQTWYAHQFPTAP